MLTRHIEHLPLAPDQNLIESVELGRFRAVGQVPGMNEEIRSDLISTDFVQGGLQRCSDISIGRLIEADMAVADLHKAEVRRAISVFMAAKRMRNRNTSGEG